MFMLVMIFGGIFQPEIVRAEVNSITLAPRVH